MFVKQPLRQGFHGYTLPLSFASEADFGFRRDLYTQGVLLFESYPEFCRWFQPNCRRPCYRPWTHSTLTAVVFVLVLLLLRRARGGKAEVAAH